MTQEETWFETDDGTKLFLRRWLPGPDVKPRAALHVVHGMAEHGLRYRRLAEKFTGAGIEVWAADQRGYGKTADLSVNGPGKGGILGHCADSDGFERVTADVLAINQEIRKERPGPLFLMGHSWGSFITQNYIEQYDNDTAGCRIDGCALSGTRGPGGFKVKMGIFMMTLFAALWGRRNGSPLARAVADGPYNKPFRPNRTSFDWLSRDEAEVDAYVRDLYSGNLCSTGFYHDLMKGLYRIHQAGAMARIRKDLPICVFSGSADPVGDMGASPTALVNVYRSLGITDLEFALYPDARHETLNETNREEVMDNLLLWVERHTDAAGNAPEGA
ncbi:MAG: alpha/beta hydrolase [Treponema sp.]|jgi:alpha-beta hydrolase superfamily lysophospholipase|nr:alpha/beta hydrolase [Treponema sp.]